MRHVETKHDIVLWSALNGDGRKNTIFKQETGVEPEKEEEK